MEGRTPRALTEGRWQMGRQGRFTGHNKVTKEAALAELLHECSASCNKWAAAKHMNQLRREFESVWERPVCDCGERTLKVYTLLVVPRLVGGCVE